MIDKSKIINSSDDDEIKLTLSKACDLYSKALHTTRIFFTRFLSPLEIMIINQRFPKNDVKLGFSGGYEDAERQLCAFYTYEEDAVYPICTLNFKIKSKNSTLSHRDYLGSVLSLGIKRETIGDIVITDDGAIVFCLEEIADYIINNLTKIGGNGVTVTRNTSLDTINIKRDYDQKDTTVSSLRCDTVVAAFLNLSRAKATQYIERGLVTLNYETVKSVSESVKNEDVLSVRGHGKFRVKTDGRLTKKGRIHITICKYK